MERRRLVAELRRLRAHTGLSYVRLGSHTGYSRSSWERFLNGKQLPPRSAVEALARLAGADPTRVIRCWELASDSGPAPAVAPLGRAETVAPADAFPVRPATIAPGGLRPSRVPTRWSVLLGAVLFVLVAALVYATPRGGTHRWTPSAGDAVSAGAGTPGKECQADATVLRAAWIGHVRVQLLHSHACGAVWARAERLLDGEALTVSVGERRADATGRPDSGSLDSPSLPAIAGESAGACVRLHPPATVHRTCTSTVQLPDTRP